MRARSFGNSVFASGTFGPGCENVVIPLRLQGDTLFLAAADPDDILLADKLTFILNKKIRLVRYPRQQLLEAINRHYGQAETESVSSMLTEFTDTAIEFTQTESMSSMATHTGAAPTKPPRLRGLLGGLPEVGRPIPRPAVKLMKAKRGIEDEVPVG